MVWGWGFRAWGLRFEVQGLLVTEIVFEAAPATRDEPPAAAEKATAPEHTHLFFLFGITKPESWRGYIHSKA